MDPKQRSFSNTYTYININKCILPCADYTRYCSTSLARWELSQVPTILNNTSLRCLDGILSSAKLIQYCFTLLVKWDLSQATTILKIPSHRCSNGNSPKCRQQTHLILLQFVIQIGNCVLQYDLALSLNEYRICST